MKKIFSLLLIMLCLSTSAQYTKLLDFVNDTLHGIHPCGGLISDGTYLYGMTTSGGATYNGTIYKIMPNGSGYMKLFDFSRFVNGDRPYGSLIYDGTFLYGMTNSGGSIYVDGNIFKIKTDGSAFAELFNFNSVTGGYPFGSLFYDGSFLYGMTSVNGVNSKGNIFKIMSNGTGYADLLDFAGTTNGDAPTGSLISDGIFLYGTTTYGGASTNCTGGCGTLFKIMPNGTGYAKLMDFAGATTGDNPMGDLFSDGTFLYGMTRQGGVYNKGTVLK